MPHVLACATVFILFYEQGWQGGVFRLLKNDQFLVVLSVWVLFPKFFGRLRSGLYKNCMER